MQLSSRAGLFASKVPALVVDASIHVLKEQTVRDGR